MGRLAAAEALRVACSGRMERCIDGFASTLVGFTLETLEADPSPIFAISKRCEIVYFNPAYRVFAERNDAAATVLKRFPIGSNVLDAIGGDARERYAERFAQIVHGQAPWFHDYTCSSPERFREFRQGAYPLKDGSGIVLVSSLTVERPLRGAQPDERPPLEQLYEQSTGLITQCSNCRRTLRNDGSEVWDWVPDWVAAPPSHTSHTICSVCFDYHWRR